MRFRVGQHKQTIPVILKKYLLGALVVLISRYFFLPLTKKDRKTITIVSHTFSGNAREFALWLRQNKPQIKVYFMADDPTLYKKLASSWSHTGISLLSMQKIRHMRIICRSSVICTTHGPAFLKYWKGSKHNPYFVEFWHGVGFKGSIRNSIKEMDFYRFIFVSSPSFKNIYKRFGFTEKQLKITGYARTDTAMRPIKNKKERNYIFSMYGLDVTGIDKVVLIAPTFKQDVAGLGSLLGHPLDSVFAKLQSIAEDNDALFIIRPHLNTGALSSHIHNYPNISIVPSVDYPDTENLLRITDILVTDWSSIFTDFLATKRPIIFLDTPPEFDGAGLLPEDRAGYIVKELEELGDTVEALLKSPETYSEHHDKTIRRVVQKAWGHTLDSGSSQRYYNAIKELFDES